MKNHTAAAVKLLDELEFLLERYSDEPRATTQPFYLRRAQNDIPGYKYHPDDTLVRETHMDHIGSLPIVATSFFPHLLDNKVDLGQALIMLAIHDIGEVVTGDEMTFTKKAGSKVREREAALRLLHPSYRESYDDIDKQTSHSAKFAKAIDKITPDIYDYLTPADITIWRYKHFVGIEPAEIIPLIKKKKRPYMLWNPFMTEFHKLLLDRLAAKLNQSS